MASIYKRGGKKNRQGKYIASYFNEHGKRIDGSTGTSDYDSACQIAAKWETEVALRRRGIISASQARVAEHGRTPFDEHVEEYLQHCEHIEQSAVHIGNKRAQLRRLVESTGITRLADLEPGPVERYLATLVKAGLSHRTHNQHRATIVSFAEWCVEQGRMASNPLKLVPALNEAKDRRRVRRAMTAEELARLMAGSGDRTLYYLFAYYTGLRVKAVKAAVWADVDFDAATIRVQAANAKGKREDIYCNLHPRLIEELKQARPAFALDNRRIFPAVPTIRTFHRDCQRAGIDRYDSQGRQLDRHALRTTLGTHLARAGVLPQQAMKVLGHTDVRITMKHYTDLRLSDTAKAIQALPAIEPQTAPAALTATGTDGQMLGESHIQHVSQQSGGLERQFLSATVPAGVASLGENSNSQGAESPSKTSAADAVGPPLTATGLMEPTSGDNILKTRAVSAVG